MTGKSSCLSIYRGRREFLGGLSVVTTTLIAGCGSRKGSETNEITTPAESSDKREQEGEQVLGEEIEDLESVYDSLSKLPVVEDEEFVFDVNHFEEEFGYKSLVNQVTSVERAIDSTDNAEMPSVMIDTLHSIASTAKLLVQQRALTHQIIAAGLTCEQHFYDAEIEESIEAIEHARKSLTYLNNVGERIEETMPKDPGVEFDIDGYDPATIKRTQKMLAEIVLWTGPAFEGIYRVTRGMQQFKGGNGALEEEQYEEAKIGYRKSDTNFERAQEAFDVAQGRGTKLPYLVPLVEQLRCILPAYVSNSGQLAESMQYLQAGNNTRGKEIARDAIDSANQIASRCIRGR